MLRYLLKFLYRCKIITFVMAIQIPVGYRIGDGLLNIFCPADKISKVFA